MVQFKKFNITLLLMLIFTGVFMQITTVGATVVSFTQGQGYIQGAYDSNAHQPTSTSWNRNSRFAGVNTNLYTKWTYAIGNTNYAPTIGADGTVYIANMGASGTTKLYAINPDGTLKWIYNTNYPAYTSPIIGSDGTIYLGVTQRLLAVNPNGTLKFIHLFSGKAISGIALNKNGSVIITSSNGYIISFDPIQVAVQWETFINANDVSAPSIANDGTIIVQAADMYVKLIAVNSEGALKWDKILSPKGSSAIEEIFYTAPPIDKNGNVYAIGRTEAVLYSVNPNGDVNWTYAVGGMIYTYPVIDEQNDTIYIGQSKSQAELTALNMDGTVKWKLVPGISVYTTPLIDKQGLIYVWGPSILKVITKDGVVLTSFNTAGRHDLSMGEDGTIYLNDGALGMLHAIGGTVVDLTPPSPVQNGLNAEYFNNDDLTDLRVTKVDPQIDFNWGSTAPNALIDPETYSVRWTGKVQPIYTDTYTFHALTDDGVRLWINGQLIIDQWQTNSVSEFTGTITLVANQKYDIKLEYFNGPRNGFVQLQWSSQLQTKEVIPANAFFVS